jgi:hypothetical protein
MATGGRPAAGFAAGVRAGVGLVDVVVGHDVAVVIVIVQVLILLVLALRPGLVGIRA